MARSKPLPQRVIASCIVLLFSVAVLFYILQLPTWSHLPCGYGERGSHPQDAGAPCCTTRTGPDLWHGGALVTQSYDAAHGAGPPNSRVPRSSQRGCLRCSLAPPLIPCDDSKVVEDTGELSGKTLVGSLCSAEKYPLNSLMISKYCGLISLRLQSSDDLTITLDNMWYELACNGKSFSDVLRPEGHTQNPMCRYFNLPCELRSVILPILCYVSLFVIYRVSHPWSSHLRCLKNAPVEWLSLSEPMHTTRYITYPRLDGGIPAMGISKVLVLTPGCVINHLSSYDACAPFVLLFRGIRTSFHRVGVTLNPLHGWPTLSLYQILCYQVVCTVLGCVKKPYVNISPPASHDIAVYEYNTVLDAIAFYSENDDDVHDILPIDSIHDGGQ